MLRRACILAAVLLSLTMRAQRFEVLPIVEQVIDTVWGTDGRPDISVSDSLLSDPLARLAHVPRLARVPVFYRLPAIYVNYQLPTADTIQAHAWDKEHRYTEWLTSAIATNTRMRDMQQRYMIAHPDRVRYNAAWLPKAPGKLRQDIDPRKEKVSTREIRVTDEAAYLHPQTYNRINWIHTFEGSLQFSQAYISPNWYQGGTNNLNLIGAIRWAVELNQAFHPKLLFNFDIRYKVGVNNAPDDSLHKYNISEDLLQINTTFGYKALRRWYYSVNAMFKTQLLNSYKKNSHEMAASFLSPGELNIGVGMTYNYVSPRKSFTVDVSLSPLSYNLKTCVSDRVPHSPVGIADDARSVSEIGSNAEMRLKWRLSYNISLNSRLFAFTDYGYAQADLEATLQFDINRFLTTQLYAHARYDTRTVRPEGSTWHKLQLKEILSLGFSYRFSTK